MNDWTEFGAQQHNRTLLRHITGVDPHRWFAAERVEGLQFDWWSVDFQEADGARLGAVDISSRPDPDVREWPFAEAVTAVGSAWPSGPIVMSSKGVLQAWRPEVLRLPRLEGDRIDPAELDAYRAAAQRLDPIQTVFSGPTITAADQSFESVAVGMDMSGRVRLAVNVEAAPLHREDCLGQADFAFGGSPTAGLDADRDSDEQADLIVKLGAMTDRWCPLAAGDPIVAQRATRRLDVEIAAVELTVEWFTLRWEQLGADAPWWCAWCHDVHPSPAPYVAGGTAEGTVACEDHLADAAAVEAAEISKACR